MVPQKKGLPASKQWRPGPCLYSVYCTTPARLEGTEEQRPRGSKHGGGARKHIFLRREQGFFSVTDAGLIIEN